MVFGQPQTAGEGSNVEDEPSSSVTVCAVRRGPLCRLRRTPAWRLDRQHRCPEPLRSAPRTPSSRDSMALHV